MSSKILVLGYGAVGQATAEHLLRKGFSVTVGQRRRPANLSTGMNFISCDVMNAQLLQKAFEGFDQLVLAIGFEYTTKIWQEQWPQAMRNIVQASAVNNLRVVFVDNLYMYGPQDVPLSEDMPLSDRPGKTQVRAEVSRIWQEAIHDKGLKFTALRAADFFGPGVLLSQLGEIVFGSLAKKGAAKFLVPIDHPHDFAYVPDIARAVGLLLEAPDDVYGEIWHMPCDNTRTLRELVTIGAKALGVQPKFFNTPLWSLGILGMVFPLAKELWDMRFQWNRPYIVHADKFTKRFSFAPTPFNESIVATAKSFVD